MQVIEKEWGFSTLEGTPVVQLANGKFARPEFVKEIYFRMLTRRGFDVFPPHLHEEIFAIMEASGNLRERIVSPLNHLSDVWTTGCWTTGDHSHYVRARDGSNSQWLLLGHRYQAAQTLLWHTAFKLYPKAVTFIFNQSRKGKSQVTPPQSLRSDFRALFTHVSQSLGDDGTLGFEPWSRNMLNALFDLKNDELFLASPLNEPEMEVFPSLAQMRF